MFTLRQNPLFPAIANSANIMRGLLTNRQIQNETQANEIPQNNRISRDIGRETGRYDAPRSVESFGAGFM